MFSDFVNILFAFFSFECRNFFLILIANEEYNVAIDFLLMIVPHEFDVKIQPNLVEIQFPL